MKLLGRPTSINVRKVLWLLDELALPFEHEPWGTPELPLTDPGFRALSPQGLVPVLVDGDLVLRESNTLCRYLAAREGRTDLLPAAPAARAVVEQWMDWQATELNNAWRHAFMGLVRRHPDYADPAAIAVSVAAWNRAMQMLDAQLQRGGAWVAGDTFTLADLVLGLSHARWRAAPIEHAVLPAVDAWRTRLLQRPAYGRHGENGMP